MNVEITLNMPGAKLPTRQHPKDAGLDVYMPDDGVLRPGPNCINLGISVDVPNGYMANLYPRSSMNKIGIISLLAPIDAGYNGNIHLLVFNGTDKDYHYKQGDRLCQLVFHNIAVVTPRLKCCNSRGDNGLGSSGK